MSALSTELEATERQWMQGKSQETTARGPPRFLSRLNLRGFDSLSHFLLQLELLVAVSTGLRSLREAFAPRSLPCELMFAEYSVTVFWWERASTAFRVAIYCEIGHDFRNI